jgi:pimeloyl-ACP methyl ester carboxylesterase/DNA-binding CsgD family transcriptional regulator
MVVLFTSGAVRIAFEVLGRGDQTIVVVPGWISHLEYDWRLAKCRAMYRRLSDKRRLVRYDRRGTGLSDRPTGRSAHSVDRQLVDLDAVFDAVGIERGVLLAWAQGGPIAIAFAATRPSRVSHLILYSTWAKAQRGHDYPFGNDDQRNLALLELVRADWGLGSRALAAALIPQGSPDELARFTALQQAAASPQLAAELLASGLQMDVRHLLPKVAAPTLILHRSGDVSVPLSHSDYLAEHLPGASLRLLPGVHHLPYLGETQLLTRAIDDFLSAGSFAAQASPGDRALSPRELEVLRLTAEGHRNREIASRLAVSRGTVSRHLVNIYSKLGVSTRAAAAAYAFRNGLV